MGANSIKFEYPPIFGRGFYAMTLAEARDRFVVAFPQSLTRRGIMDGLCGLVERLNRNGVVGEVWLDGSFVTEKIDPEDVDILIRVSSALYDNDRRVRDAVDWASQEERRDSHNCDSYKWIEYDSGHPLFPDSENDRNYWTRFFGTSRKGVAKGIVTITIPAVMP